MIGHKERTFFYPLQLRDFVREHGAALPIGVPIALDALRQERYCIVRPNRFRFYHELCGANGLPLNFFISMRHIFTGASPVFYASARAELMRMGEHPMFTLVDNWDPLQRFGLRRNNRPQLQMPLHVRTIARMAEFVWEKLPFHSVYSRRHAFSLVMTVLEGRLTLATLVERARNGSLPKKWEPMTFSFQNAELATDRLLNRTSPLVPSPRAKSRFLQNDDIQFCVPLYSKFCGSFACVASENTDLFEDLPAYFVVQTGKGWQLLLSDSRAPKPEAVAQGKGLAAKCQTKILAAITQHLISALLNETGQPSLLMNLAHVRFFKINLVPMTPTDRVKCYEDVFDHYMKKLHKVFVTPEKYTDKNGDDVHCYRFLDRLSDSTLFLFQLPTFQPLHIPLQSKIGSPFTRGSSCSTVVSIWPLPFPRCCFSPAAPARPNALISSRSETTPTRSAPRATPPTTAALSVWN